MDRDVQRVLTQATVDAAVAARVLGVSKATIYKACETGELHSFRLLQSVRIPTPGLRKLLQLSSASAQEAA